MEYERYVITIIFYTWKTVSWEFVFKDDNIPNEVDSLYNRKKKTSRKN